MPDFNRTAPEQLTLPVTLREIAESYWRLAKSEVDPEGYRWLAMRYHTAALILEAGGTL